MYEKFCDRCNCEMRAYRISWFNSDVICHLCQEHEEQHPLFTYAKKVENEEQLKGNRKFKGLYAHLKWDDIQKRTPQQTEYAQLVNEIASRIVNDDETYDQALYAGEEAFLYEENRYTLKEILFANNRTFDQLKEDVMKQTEVYLNWQLIQA